MLAVVPLKILCNNGYMQSPRQTHLTLLELYRRARGWSQTDLARHLGSGFTASSISMMEAQRLKPSRRQEQRLREVFGDQAEAMLQPIDPAGVSAHEGQPS
jgi:transcriptional regulator with XRE-family HTH domain